MARQTKEELHMAALRWETRMKFLLQAYRSLESVAGRGQSSANWSEFESAVAEIQLFGSARQVQLIREVLETLMKTRRVDLIPVLEDLRRHLRRELDLEEISEPLMTPRYRPPDETAK